MTVRNSVAAFTGALNSAIPADASPLQTNDISGDEVRQLLLDIVETAFDAGVMQGVVLTSGSVDATVLAANAVTTAKVANAAITSAKIGASQVTASELASGAVTSAKVAANAITAGKIADDAVDTDEIADNAVTTAKIADGNITGAKLHATIGPFLRTALEGLAANARLNINDGTQGDLVVSRIPSAIMRNDEFVAELTAHLVGGNNIQFSTNASGNRVISATGGSGGGITLQEARNEIASWAQAGDNTEIPAAKIEEVVEDLVGAMVEGNTEAGITVGYNDITGKLNFTVTVPSPATWARATGATGTIPDARIPSTIARDSELPAAPASWARGTGATGTVPAARIDKAVIKDIVGEMVTGNTETGITVTYQAADDTLDFVVTGSTTPPVSMHQRYGVYGADSTFTVADLTGGVSSMTDSLTLSGATGRQWVAFWSAQQLTTIVPVGRLSGLGLQNLLNRFTETRLQVPAGGTNGYLYVSTTDFPAGAINGEWTLS